jgi:pilus assembly protein CpaF
VSRLQDGSRKIMAISEVLGAHDDHVELQDVFIFERLGITDTGKVKGRFRGTGVIPKIVERLKVSGITLPDGLFDEVMNVNME